mmetsp:Transcript_2725/g.11019  ORF Transcript_2725/g.11019 Transcript_2725/m.11019 type:complete len:254 (+) Transcript_2725:902-1663(+)
MLAATASAPMALSAVPLADCPGVKPWSAPLPSAPAPATRGQAAGGGCGFAAALLDASACWLRAPSRSVDTSAGLREAPLAAPAAGAAASWPASPPPAASASAARLLLLPSAGGPGRYLRTHEKPLRVAASAAAASAAAAASWTPGSAAAASWGREATVISTPALASPRFARRRSGLCRPDTKEAPSGLEAAAVASLDGDSPLAVQAPKRPRAPAVPAALPGGDEAPRPTDRSWLRALSAAVCACSLARAAIVA